MSRVRKRSIGEGILLLEFSSQYELASSFLRIQEHYESKAFRGKTFGLEEYMDWYAKTFGNFTYYQDWSGFNVPFTAFEPFYSGVFDPLLAKERALLELVEPHFGAYVIGLCSYAADRVGTLQHEIAHALFHTRPVYRREVERALRGYNTSALRARLSGEGYCRQVLTDEAHAYILSGLRDLPARERRQFAPLQRRLATLYREHAKAAGVSMGRRERAGRGSKTALT